MLDHLIRRACVVLLLIGPLLPLAAASASHLAENPKKHRVVYQLDDAGVDKAKFVLGNLQNHMNGVGREHLEAVELVVFGPALKTFVKKQMDPDIRQVLERLQIQGLVFGACGNTMKNFNLTLEELPDGAKRLPQGGVVRLMELQEQGYIYIRP